MKSTNNILIFGCDFFSEKKSSEINYWNDMVDELSRSVSEVVIISVNNRDVIHEKIGENVHIYNVKPRYIGNDGDWKDPDYSGKRFQKMPFSVVYKTYSFITYLTFFEKIINKHNIRIVHYMRGFGLLNSLLVKRYPGLLFSITVPTHVDRGFPLHVIYHSIKNMTLKPMDKVISTSIATSEQLKKMGIDENKLEVVHWTLKEEQINVSPDEISALKTRHEIDPENKVVLWAGPLQDTGESEFYYSIEIAKRVVAGRDDVVFIFALKPDKLNHLIRSDVTSFSERIRVVETSRDKFTDYRIISDIFLSPVINKNRTLAPPLTWIEMMRQGIPVITNRINGAVEIIEHGNDGFIFEDQDEFVQLILNFHSDDIRRAGEFAKRKVRDEFDIEDISRQYLAIWEKAINMKAGTG